PRFAETDGDGLLPAPHSRASAGRVRDQVPQHDHTERHSEYPRNDVSHRSSLCRETLPLLPCLGPTLRLLRNALLRPPASGTSPSSARSPAADRMLDVRRMAYASGMRLHHRNGIPPSL